LPEVVVSNVKVKDRRDIGDVGRMRIDLCGVDGLDVRDGAPIDSEIEPDGVLSWCGVFSDIDPRGSILCGGN
jgi:hypothetical protein